MSRMTAVTAGIRRLFLTVLESEREYLRRDDVRFCAECFVVALLIAALVVWAWVTI